MALGFTAPTNSADFLPRVQYDARSGRLHKIERSQDRDGNWESEAVEVKLPIMTLMDFENIEVGWIKFGGGAPDFKLVKIGENLPPKPTELDANNKPAYKQGFRIKLYSKKFLGGLREFSHTASCVLAQIDALHTQYEAEKAANKGKVPLVSWLDTVAIKTGSGPKSSTNYAPVFKLESWQPKPAEFEVPEAPPAVPATTKPVTSGGHVPPPAAKAAPAPTADDGTEF